MCPPTNQDEDKTVSNAAQMTINDMFNHSIKIIDDRKGADELIIEGGLSFIKATLKTMKQHIDQ